MPANLPQQYHRAERALRRAQTPREELECLQAMLVELPKHKGTDKMQADLKQKISRLKKDIAAGLGKTNNAKTTLKIPRQGAGRVIIIGGPNAGKSQLLTHLTRATPEVAEYPFTTREPSVGMMPWQDVFVQLIDTPPITRDLFTPTVQSLIRGADLVLLLVDLGSDEGGDQLKELWDRIDSSKTRLSLRSYFDEQDVGVTYTQALLVPNKIDLPAADDRRDFFNEIIQLDLSPFPVSALTGTGTEELAEAIFRCLDIVRIYTKQPGKKPDMEKPYTLPRGGTVIEVAGMIHHEFAKNFKSAKVWGANVHDATIVQGDYVLKDNDIVELHV